VVNARDGAWDHEFKTRQAGSHQIHLVLTGNGGNHVHFPYTCRFQYVGVGAVAHVHNAFRNIQQYAGFFFLTQLNQADFVTFTEEIIRQVSSNFTTTDNHDFHIVLLAFA